MRENKGIKVFLYRVTCATENYSLLKNQSKALRDEFRKDFIPFYFYGEKTENVPFSYSKEFLNYIPIFYIPKKSTHIWCVDIPGNLKPGDHVLRIEFTDRYGKLYSNERKFSIIQESAQ